MKLTVGNLGFAIAFALGMNAVAAYAQPAPWYKWQSKLDGKIICMQTSPGDGWTRYGGPYKDARCEKPGTR